MGLLYSDLKIFHFKDKLDLLIEKEKRITPPIHIRIKPINVCCHNCRYCAYGKNNFKQFGKDKVEETYIPKEKMIEIIEDIIDMGVKAITFSGGGEPFLYPHFYDVLKKLAKSDIKFSALTNGSLLEGDVAKIFAQYGTWVRISMDGWDDKSYSFYRDVPEGEFTKIMTNMENFKKYSGNCHLGVSFIVDEKNAPHVYEMLKKLRSIGVDSVKVSPCLVNDSAADNNNYHKPFFKDVELQIQRAINDFGNDTFQIFNAYKELGGKFKKDYQWCPFIQILPVIGADLNIYACPDKAYNLRSGVIGSIKNQRLKDFWFSDKNKFFMINPSIHCDHHCERNRKNKLVLEYLDVEKKHLSFI